LEKIGEEPLFKKNFSTAPSKFNKYKYKPGTKTNGIEIATLLPKAQVGGSVLPPIA
jgi:hypothetical protein